MAKARGGDGVQGEAWIQELAGTLGAQVGRVIAESLQRALETSIDVGGLAEQLGLGAGPKGSRKGLKAGGLRLCSETGCRRPVLAKGFCRSHYYKARYRAQKDGSLVPKKRGRKPGRPPKAEKGAAEAQAEPKPEVAPGWCSFGPT
jgi:hypothetical protein